MKKRRHHNNKGYRQVKRGKTHEQVEAMARRLRRSIKRKDNSQDHWPFEQRENGQVQRHG